FRQSLADFEELVLRRVVDEALEEVEADAADAPGVEPGQLFLGDRRIDHRDAAGLAVRPGDRVERRGIVGAVAARLDDHVLREPEVVAQCEQHLGPGVVGQVLGPGAERELRHRPEHVAMRVDRAGRRDEARLRGVRVPGYDAVGHSHSLLSSLEGRDTKAWARARGSQPKLRGACCVACGPLSQAIPPKGRGLQANTTPSISLRAVRSSAADSTSPVSFTVMTHDISPLGCSMLSVLTRPWGMVATSAAGEPSTRHAVAAVTAPSTPMLAWARCGMNTRV